MTDPTATYDPPTPWSAPKKPARRVKPKPLDERWPPHVWIVVVAAILFTALGPAAAVFTWSTVEGTNAAEARGQAGDFLGGHIAAFANLASFCVVFAALLLQRRELAMQRQAIELQVDEMTEQRLALEGQQAELAAQTRLLMANAQEQQRAAAALERAALAQERAADAHTATAAAASQQVNEMKRDFEAQKKAHRIEESNTLRIAKAVEKGASALDKMKR